MSDLKKIAFTCGICNKILKDPIHLPCYCTICIEHFSDNSVKDGLIKCETCEDVFVVKGIIIKENKRLKKVLEAEHHLTNQEKEAKKEIHDQIEQFQQLYEQFMNNSTNFDMICHKHFAEIQRQIDLQREELKVKIDDLAAEMMNKIKETEKIYRQNFFDIQKIKIFDIDIERQDLENHFRDVNLTIASIQELKAKNELNLNQLQNKINNLNLMKGEMEKCDFKSNTEFNEASFGDLNLKSFKKYLISSSQDNALKMRDLNKNECFKILNGHTDVVASIEIISNNQLISGSYDKTLKIWDLESGTLIKTLYCINEKILCLKVLSNATVAVGCYMKIKILNIEDDVCIKTLNDHSCWIRDLITLSDGTLVSGSQDTTITFWNINNGQCLKTLYGHIDYVNCLLLLKNGQLASGSKDKTIKIWNTSTGDGIKTLEGHTDRIWCLESSDNFDLISCSEDKTIKIWNLTTDECIKTLVGHNGGITCIKHYFGDFLLSGSADRTIKVWDLIKGICTQTLTGQNHFIQKLLVI